MTFITARIRIMTEDNVFTWYTIPGGYPHLADGRVPQSCLMVRGGTPSFLMGVSPSFPMGSTPSFLMGVPLVRTGWGYSPSGLDGGNPPSGLDGVPLPPIRTGWGNPWSRLDGGTPSPIRTGRGTLPPPPKTEQKSEHLLCGRRYASCVHAGGLSCSFDLDLDPMTSIPRYRQDVSAH